MKMPATTAPAAELVAFCKWNDRNGNWPDHVDMLKLELGADAPELASRPSPAHVWYDWEGDKWYTEEACRVEINKALAEDRLEEQRQ